MLLFAGLGNPGPSYLFNRHNVGFLVAEAIHDRYQFRDWQNRAGADIAVGEIAGIEVLIAKPSEYMNESGRAIGAISKKHRIATENIFVFHDQIEMKLGRVKLIFNGGDSGHNGLRSITERAGGEYFRVRIGVDKPIEKEFVHQHVLSDFSPAERLKIHTIVDSIAEAAELLVLRKFDEFQQQIDSALIGQGLMPSHLRTPPSGWKRQ